MHWNRLLQARAIENLSYVAGVNRVGMDEKHQHYSGDSSVFSSAGEVVFTSQEPGAFVVELFAGKLKEHRANFPAYMDADEFEIKR